MKKLSIEEKAQRYDEAIKVAKFNYDTIIQMDNECTFAKEVIVNTFHHMFPELIESEDERIKKTLIHIVKGACSKYGIKYQGKEIGEEKLLAWLENQGEQEPTDKVEPKFKVGDWVVYNNDVCQIVKREEGCNKLVTNFGIEKELVNERNLSTARLWTIQDAKRGDILSYDKSKCIAMFLKIESVSFKDICCIGAIDGKFYIGSWHDIENAHPATKEQRDLLFQKMKEAGYEWDTEKKELRKIEQNLANVFNIYEKSLLEKFKQAVYDCAWGKVTCKKEGETKEEYANRWAEHFLIMVRDWADDYIDYEENVIARRAYDKGKQDIQNPAWSEDENDMGNIWYAETWLKSLKERYTWKPNGFDIKLLEGIANGRYNPHDFKASLWGLINQLKKLREE